MAKALDTIWNGGKAEGKAEGLAEGKAEGLAEGKAEGLAEGKAKQKEAFARKLLNAHFSDADIISYAEISAQRMKELKAQMRQRWDDDHFSSS